MPKTCIVGGVKAASKIGGVTTELNKATNIVDVLKWTGLGDCKHVMLGGIDEESNISNSLLGAMSEGGGAPEI